MAGLSGIVKKISDLVTGTPADDDCFIFGKTDFKKITLAKLKDALGITSINSALGGMALIDDTSISGGTILTMQNSMTTEHLYIAFIRVFHGSDDLLAPWAYLLYMRPENWDYVTIGEEQKLVSKVIQNGKLTLTFEDQRWVRMVTYRIF